MLQDPLDILPTTVPEDNTSQEIMTMIAYNSRLPFALSDDEQKAAMATLLKDWASPHWLPLSNALKNSPDNTSGGAIAYDETVPNVKVVSAGDLQTFDTVAPKYRDITVLGLDGQKIIARVYLITTTHNGQPFNWWIQD